MSFIESRRGIFVCLWTDHQTPWSIHTHMLGFCTLTSSYCYQMLTGMLCLSIVAKPFFLLCIYTPPKTNMAIGKNMKQKTVEDVSPIKQWWVVHFHVSFAGTYTSQQATFPLQFQMFLPCQDTDKLAKSKAPKSSTSKCPFSPRKKIGGRKGWQFGRSRIFLNPAFLVIFRVEILHLNQQMGQICQFWNPACLLILDNSLMLQFFLQVILGCGLNGCLNTTTWWKLSRSTPRCMTFKKTIHSLQIQSPNVRDWGLYIITSARYVCSIFNHSQVSQVF